MKVQTKRAAVDLTDLAIGIIVLGIVVSIGAYILTTARDSRLTDLSAISTVNETFTNVDETGETFSNGWFKSLTQCANTTGGTVIAPGNYTVTVNAGGQGSIISTGSSFNGTDWSCTYNWYNTSRPDYAVANAAAVGIGEYGNWFKIIVIVGVAAIVLSIIFMAFGKSSSSTTY